MSLQQDTPLDLHKLSQRSQHPPPYSAHQWTCEPCKSTFGSLEQREIHQQECSGRNLSAQQAQFSTTVSSRSGYAPRPESAEVPSNVSYPPNPMMYLQRMPGNTRHHLASPAPPQVPTGKRRVVLHWVKESPTLDLEVTYIDDTDGGLVLKWNSQSEWFQCETALSLGQHSGCLTLGRRETVLPIKPFFVEQGAASPQKIVISTGQNRIASRVPRTVAPAVIARETERDTGGSEKVRALERDLNRLTADLDARNNELVQERLKCSASLETYRSENEGLSQEVERLTRDNSRLRDVEKKGTSEFPVELEKLQLQAEAWERRQGEMEREAKQAKEDKQVANEYSDYLHEQKKLLEGELLELKRKLEDSLTENARLKVSIEGLSKGTKSSPPPLPRRSKPILKAPIPQSNSKPPPKESSGGDGEESEK